MKLKCVEVSVGYNELYPNQFSELLRDIAAIPYVFDAELGGEKLEAIRDIMNDARSKLFAPTGTWSNRLDRANAQIKVAAFDKIQVLLFGKKRRGH